MMPPIAENVPPTALAHMMATQPLAILALIRALGVVSSVLNYAAEIIADGTPIDEATVKAFTERLESASTIEVP